MSFNLKEKMDEVRASIRGSVKKDNEKTVVTGDIVESVEIKEPEKDNEPIKKD